ncbi:MAG: TadE/TadG family type IV pilus assembly protein [Paracoccaceae bacterium]
MKPFRSLLRRLAGFRDDNSGAATVEFVIIAPIFLGVVLSVFESGWLTTQSMMLERGLDKTVRDLRLNDNASFTHDELKASVCGYSKILRDCEANLLLELVSIDNGLPFPAPSANCVDRTGTVDPVVHYVPGAESAIMFIRACVIIDPIFPGIGLGLQLSKDASGGFAMVAYSAFVNEPD